MVSPLDLQVNLGHVHDVAKAVQGHTNAEIAAHQTITKEAETESNKQKDTVHTTDESEQAHLELNPEGRSNREKRELEKKKKEAEKKEEKKANLFENPALGKNVDFTG